jgi:hypothetical protein
MLLYECKKKAPVEPAARREKMYIRNIEEVEEILRIARVLGRHGHAQTLYNGSRRLTDIVDRLFGDDPQKKEFLIAARIAINELRAR